MSRRIDTSLAFPIRPDGHGGLALAVGAKSVEDSIKAILLSPQGSHQIEKWLGLPLFIFQPTPSINAAIEAIVDAIIDGEDRVEPDSIEVSGVLNDEGVLAVEVVYRIKGEADTRTLSQEFRKLV